MEKKCGRCKGTGQMHKPYKDIWGDWHKLQRCDVCGGNGQNPNYREKQCEYSGCWTIVSYHKDAQHPPKYCPQHKEIAQREQREARRWQATAQQNQNSERHRQNSARTNQPGTRGGRYGEQISWPEGRALPGSDRSLNDLRSQGVVKVAVRSNPNGGHHVTLEMSKDTHYSYDTDSSGNYIFRRGHFTDKAAKLLGKDTIGPNATNHDRW